MRLRAAVVSASNSRMSRSRKAHGYPLRASLPHATSFSLCEMPTSALLIPVKAAVIPVRNKNNFNDCVLSLNVI